MVNFFFQKDYLSVLIEEAKHRQRVVPQGSASGNEEMEMDSRYVGSKINRALIDQTKGTGGEKMERMMPYQLLVCRIG